MPKKREKKTAKGRLDKFYWLAKEQGFRSRAAFKLVQLNKKFNFLENARCCIDLCAAPGGWLQVASKHMPPNSLIVGVDLVPIKPIPRCITFAEDINSFKCRDELRTTLKDWKADIVLHDGAPNVGTAWVQDAYTQSELVLQSLKLAVEFLAPGGHFVTKVFRSKDYNNLMWVFNQLFRRVEATKPPSSRNVSAEIFVVCQDFKAPRRIDPKFLDPQHVFKDLEPLKEAAGEGTSGGIDPAMKGTSALNAHANVFEPEKKRRKRDGYEEGNYTQFKAITAQDFVRGPDAVSMLGTYNQITFKTPEDKALLDHHESNEDIRVNCEDLKVLGRKDFRNLMKWRLAMREHLGIETPKAAQPVQETVETEELEPMDSDEEMDAELERLTEEEQRKLRKERRRRNEARAKKVLKMQLQMTTPMDIGMEQGDAALQGGSEDFFDLGNGPQGKPKAKPQLDVEDDEESDGGESTTISNNEDDEDGEELDSDEERERRLRRLEGDMDGMYEEYRNHLSDRDAKFRAKEERRKNKDLEEWGGIQENKGDDDGEDSDAASSVGGYDVVQSRKGRIDVDDSDSDFSDDDEQEEPAADKARRAAAKGKLRAVERSAAKRSRAEEDDDLDESSLVTTLESKKAAEARQSKEAAIWFDNPLFKGMPGLDGADVDDDEDEEEQEDDSEVDQDEEDEDEDEEPSDEEEDAASDFEVVPREKDDDDSEWHVTDLDVDAEKQRFIDEHGLTTAEAVTLAQQLVNRERTKSDLINAGFSKQNFTDKSDLPDWFLDDEGKHWKANIPITKEAMAALRARQKALDARPIKKVAEAKARKKYKAAQRMAKAQKKAEDVLANEDGEMTQRDKAKSITKLLQKGGSKAKRKETQLVVAKGPNRGLKGRPKGVKGRFKMVDGRMKKELRAQKRIDKRDGKKRSSGHGGRTKGKPRVPNGYGGGGGR
ncbi:FtsJ-domain-containing protein [Jaminaea rosea]|uniref:FtsJ-domain-containing protein n=1 Tax=Jaminaea rosea TaxID=1569628 RepID=A0A316UQ29_9BASI|nr:FtsJ-domain-containing protein [Jaminaea rosea]PWN27074.1 FtsJ-domain-containing protein [Jaminaea rosea]